MIKYNIIHDIKREDLERVSFEDEEFRQVLSSPYLISNYNRIWYKDTIYYNISLDDFFKYVIHKGEEDD